VSSEYAAELDMQAGAFANTGDRSLSKALPVACLKLRAQGSTLAIASHPLVHKYSFCEHWRPEPV